MLSMLRMLLHTLCPIERLSSELGRKAGIAPFSSSAGANCGPCPLAWLDSASSSAPRGMT